MGYEDTAKLSEQDERKGLLILFMMDTIIETDRLIIRKITSADFEDLFKLHSDSIVQKYTGEPIISTLEEVIKGSKERTFKDYEVYGYGRWAVILKSNNSFVGWAGLKYLPEFNEVDLGYRFLQKYWGMGIATESSIAILKYGFEVLELKRIIAVAIIENKASIRVMEKSGMIFDKKAPYDEGGEEDIWYKLDIKDYKRSQKNIHNI